MKGKLLQNGIVTLDVTVEELNKTSKYFREEASTVNFNQAQRLNGIAIIVDYLAKNIEKVRDKKMRVTELEKKLKKERSTVVLYLRDIYAYIHRDLRGERFY